MLVVVHPVRDIRAGASGDCMRVTDRVLGGILVQPGLIVLADIRGHEGANCVHRNSGTLPECRCLQSWD